MAIVSERVLVIGDMHGQLLALKRLLHVVGSLTPTTAGAAAPATLVLASDVVDRGPDGLGVVGLLMNRQVQAAASGGCVQPVLGNHEVQLDSLNTAIRSVVQGSDADEYDRLIRSLVSRHAFENASGATPLDCMFSPFGGSLIHALRLLDGPAVRRRPFQARSFRQMVGSLMSITAYTWAGTASCSTQHTHLPVHRRSRHDTPRTVCRDLRYVDVGQRRRR